MKNKVAIATALLTLICIGAAHRPERDDDRGNRGINARVAALEQLVTAQAQEIATLKAQMVPLNALATRMSVSDDGMTAVLFEGDLLVRGRVFASLYLQGWSGSWF